MVNHEKSLIEKLNETIDKNLSETSFSIETLSSNLGLSRSQLHRIVKKNLNFSTTLYIRHRKLLKARSLLETTPLRVSEVAYQVGIDSPQNFTKYFTQSFGLNPTDFRKTNPMVNATGGIEVSELSIAVLAFVDMSNDKNQQYFSDGISEEIINMLSKVDGLQVTARTSSFAYKDKNLDLRVIGKQLNVSHVLEGSVRKAGDKLRINVQLIKVQDGFQLWSDKFDSNIEDVFDIQDEISLKVLEEIKIKLFENERETVLKRYTDNHEAYQLYLHGRYYHNKFTGNETYKKAIKHFQSAIDLDPKYAIAFAGIASCYLNIWFYRYQLAEESLPQI
jgi:adenylate cyclase